MPRPHADTDRYRIQLARVVLLIFVGACIGGVERPPTPQFPSVNFEDVVDGSIIHSARAYPGLPSMGAVDFVSQEVGFLVRRTCGDCPEELAVTHDGGETWTMVASRDLPADFSFVSEEIGFGIAVQRCGRNSCREGIVRTTDGGRTWQRRAILRFRAPEFLGPGLDIHFVSEREGWVLAGAAIMHTADGGKSWARLPLRCPRDQNFGSVSFSDRLTGHAVCWGEGATIESFKTFFSTVDGGASWKMGFSGHSQGHGGTIEFLSHRIGFIELGRIGVLRTVDGGRTWDGALSTEVASGMSWLSRSDGFVTVGGALVRTLDAGDHWRQVYPPARLEPNRGVSFASAAEGLGSGFPSDVLGHPNTLAVTRDGGESWERAGSVRGFYDVEVLGHVTPSIVWAEGEPRTGWRTALLRSVDRGRTWQIMKTLPGLTTSFSFPTFTDGFVTDTEQRLIRTSDGGRTWRLVSDERPLWDAVFVSPHEGWAIGDDGQLLHTVDAGKGWVSVRLPGFYIDTLEFTDPQHGWVAGERCIDPSRPERCENTSLILRTLDGGRSWEVLRFPSSFWGEDLRFVSTKIGFTGGHGILYRTEDSGRTWELV